VVVRVEVPADEVDAVSDRLWQAGASAVSGEPVGGGAGAGGPAVVRLTADLDTCPPEVAEAGWPVEVFADDGEWQDAWRPFARAVRAGPFLVRPPWVPAPATPNDGPVIELVLDGGRAFGTGSHPSTTLALELLADVVVPGASVLDAGCGSGALAIGAALLGAGRVVAVDVDPAAIEATAANAGANGVTVEVVRDDVVGVTGSFDVVAANLGAPLVLDLAGVLADRTAAAGALVLSGLLDERAADVAGAYPGWTVAATATGAGWTALVLRRHPSSLSVTGRQQL
jgi:ribosomal protein L11 methyltransferase